MREDYIPERYKDRVDNPRPHTELDDLNLGLGLRTILAATVAISIPLGWLISGCARADQIERYSKQLIVQKEGTDYEIKTIPDGTNALLLRQSDGKFRRLEHVQDGVESELIRILKGKKNK